MNQAHATYSGQANPVLPSNTAHESANESAPIAQAAPVAQLAPASIAPVSWLQTEPSEPSTVFEVDNISACRDNYPEFCKLKAGGNCHKERFKFLKKFFNNFVFTKKCIGKNHNHYKEL